MRLSAFALRIPESIQTDAGFSDEIEGLWSGLTWVPGYYSQSFALGLQQVSTFLRDEASRRLAEAREVERRLHCSVASLQRQVEQYPLSEWATSQLIQAQQELRAVEERRHEFLFHRQATHWTQVGDRVSREFFLITGP